jgi:hypothetical protein
MQFQILVFWAACLLSSVEVDDERPNAAPPAQQPTPIGRLIRVFTPYGDLDGTIDPSGAGAWHNIWDDTPQPGQRGYQPGSSSASSEWPSSALKRSMFCAQVGHIEFTRRGAPHRVRAPI